jgi:hypothetical protein
LVIILLSLHLKRFCNSTPNASKATNIIQIGFELNKILSFEVKEVFGLGKTGLQFEAEDFWSLFYCP